MIRRHGFLLRAILVSVDATLAVAVLLVVAVLRFGMDGLGQLATTIAEPRTALVAYVIAWIGSLWSQDLYRFRPRWTTRATLIDILRATAIFSVASLALLFWFKLPDVSRFLLVLLFPSLAATVFLSRVVARWLLVLLRRTGRNTRFILIVGSGDFARRFATLVDANHDLGLSVVGHVASPISEPGGLAHPVMGGLDDLEKVLHENVVDEVAICLPLNETAVVNQVVSLCEEEGKIVRIPIYPLDRTATTGRFEVLDGLPVYSLVRGPDRAAALALKRTVDIVASGLLMLVLAPVAALVAVLVARSSRGSILFRQTRVGLHGRTFQMVKFRTMVSDAEELLAALAEHNEIKGPAFKIEHDPRITRVGRVLRRTSLDELPQLMNVLRGEMSLVGPRPPLPSEVDGYDLWHRRRLSMKPGITGLWQVNGRREPNFDRWVEIDLEYIDSWSLWLDFRILARTVPAMLEGR